MVTRKSFIIVISTFSTYILGMMGVMALAKIWGAESVAALGAVSFAISAVSIFSIFSRFGFTAAHIKRVSEGEDLGTCIGTYATIELGLVGVMLCVIFIWKMLLNQSFTDATTESVFAVAIVFVVFDNLKSIPINTFTGLQQAAKRQISLTFENISKLPLLILVAIFASGMAVPSFIQPFQRFVADHSTGSLAAAYVIGMATTFFIGLLLMRKYPIKRPSWDMLKSYFTFAFPLAFSSVLAVLSMHIDKVMIGFFWTSTEVGYYFVVQRITGIITVFPMAIGTILFPTISKEHALKKLDKIRNTVKLSERYISMIMVPPVMFTIIFSNQLIQILLDDAYLPGATVLMILSVWVFIMGLSMPYTSLIMGMNKPKLQASIAIVTCIINVFLNFLMVPNTGILSGFGIYGPDGAAVATVFSSLFLLASSRIISVRLTNINTYQTHTMRHIFAGCIMASYLWGISSYVTMHWYHLIIFAGSGLCIYILVLWTVSEFKREDLDFYLDILNPKKLLKEAKGDFKNGT